MTVADFVQDGDYIDHVPGSAVDAGDVVVQGYTVGIAKVAIPANTLGALAITGVYDVPKQASAGVTFAVGDLVYWDAGNDRAATSGVLMGHCVRAAVNAASSVRVRLVPSSIVTTTTAAPTTTTTSGG